MIRSFPTSSFALCLIACLRVTALASDPPVPIGGFPIVQEVDVPFTWTDGYQVLIDLRYPADPPAAGGWPLLVLVHGGGGSKQVVAGTAASLARLGYFTCAYDVRGQGPSMLNNPLSLANDLVGLRELIDLFEAMEAADSLRPTLVDLDRIGVTGFSQGGQHSWWAAQHSGRLPPPNPWRTAAFPVIGAVVPRDASGRASDDAPEAFSDRLFDKLFGNSDIVIQPAVIAALTPLVLAEDFAGLAAALDVPGMDPPTLLAQVTVPVLCHSSYDDKRINPSGVLASWSLIPPGTPKRILFGTGGHGLPNNDLDSQLFASSRLRWFNRFLKDEPNGVELEPAIHMTVTPETLGDYLGSDSLWDFRDHDVLPPATITNMRGWLHSGATLTATPAPVATSTTLVHSVPAGFDINAFANLLPSSAQLQGIIPLAPLTWDTAPLAEDRHMHGEAELSLSADTLAADYQIHAVLYDVFPNGQQRWVASGGAVVRGTPGPNTLQIRTYQQSYVFRAGHRIRLQLENLMIHRADTGSGQEVQAVPYFSSANVAIREGSANGSHIDLPILPFAAPTLVTAPLQQSVAAPVNQHVTVHSSAAHAGALYLLLPTVAGTSPPTLVAGALVPIQFDALTLAFASNPFLPPFVGGTGTLDAFGSADLGILLAGLPLPASLIGVELSAAVIVDTGAVPLASNAITIPFTP